MTDSYGRMLTYLRVSVTNQCNLRCTYCMPNKPAQQPNPNNMLTFNEITRLVQIMAQLGVTRVRLTGGEPLARKNLVLLAQQIKQINGISFLGLTTNGVLLAKNAAALCAAGVDGINLSMDTLNPARYAQITGTQLFNQAYAGLQSALQQPFKSVKINCVLAPCSTVDDWLGVATLAQKLAVDVRFIEWMPMQGKPAEAPTASFNDVYALLSQKFGTLTPADETQKREAGPANYYNINGFAGRIGFIPAISHQFCQSCNRLRLTAQGNLKLCLFYNEGLALRQLLRGSASDEEIKTAILTAVQNKPLEHKGVLLNTENQTQKNGTDTLPRPGGMADIGG